MEQNSHTSKIITGSWFEFRHPGDIEAKYWNERCRQFSAADWAEIVRETVSLGLDTLVLMAVALDDRSFYPSALLPTAEQGCPDPLEAVLCAGDRYDVRFFIGNGFWGVWDDPGILADRQAACLRERAAEELVERYGHHRSFYGWYWPNESGLTPYFSDEFIRYVNQCSSVARALTPEKKTLIAPYGTHQATDDNRFVRQLEDLDVDIIAYQDEVGVGRVRPHELEHIFAVLRQAHDRAQRAALWADIELFDFEGAVYKSPLIPTAFARVRTQLEAISPYVDKILAYQYQGLMHPPDSSVALGHTSAKFLYINYRKWLEISGE